MTTEPATIGRVFTVAPNLAEAYDLVSADVDEAIAGLRADPQLERKQPQLYHLGNQALTAAQYASVLELDTPHVCRALRIAARARAGLFALASAGSELVLPLDDGPPVRLLPSTDPMGLTPGTWCEGFFLAAATRDFDALNRLAGIDPRVFERARVRWDAWIELTCSACIKHFTSAPDTMPVIVSALEATDESKLVNSHVDTVLYEGVPWLEMLMNLELREGPAFARSFEKALLAHARLWQRPDNVDDRRGLLALGPLGLASLAHMRGLEVDAESPYAPRAIIEGACASGEGPAA